MARTTGYTATVAARMIARGLFADKGISAPEFIGQVPECVKFMLDGLKERGVVYHETVVTCIATRAAVPDGPFVFGPVMWFTVLFVPAASRRRR